MAIENPPIKPVHGLIIGQFQPPHAGHQYLIDFASSYVKHLTIIVCAPTDDPLPGELRCQWLKEMAPGARVLLLNAESPSKPHGNPSYWQAWVQTVRRRVSHRLDILFTSEEYGKELAEGLGAYHIVVDRARRAICVTGQEVRRHPLANWKYLPPVVRPYYVKRVCVFGAASTGKSTLCQRLAEHYQTQWVSEYSRKYVDEKARKADQADIPLIARGQIASEEALARQANRVLFCDTSLLITTIYSDIYFGGCPEFIRHAAERRHYDLYLVTETDVPWEDDPQRDLPHKRGEIRDRCLTELQARGRPYVIICGDWDDRFQSAVRAVDDLLREE